MSDKQAFFIASKLKEYFLAVGLTQEKISEKLKVSQSYVAAMLNGKRFGRNAAKKWGDVFGLSPNWLLTGEGEMLKSSSKEYTSVEGNKNNISKNPKVEDNNNPEYSGDKKLNNDDSLLREIQRLKSEIEHLENIVTEKDKQLEDLRENVKFLQSMLKNN